MKFTESMLKNYAAPLSASEDLKCKRAIEAIRDALKTFGYTDDQKPILPLEADTLSYAISMHRNGYANKVHIFLQGSYANNTCVRGESDVDIAIVNEEDFESAFGASFNLFTTKHKDDLVKFKDIVEVILKKHFPRDVQRKNKSIKVNGNTYRKQADTVPCYSMHFFYQSEQNDYRNYKDGIVIYADDGTIIRNFPKQHIINGKRKNTTTNHYYKKMVRIIKKIRCLMSECNYTCADKVSSFGLESLLWNIPDNMFIKYSTYRFEFGEIVNYLYMNKTLIGSYKEANGIKKLCTNQTEVQNYTEFIDKLKQFYQYDIYEVK